MAQSDIRMRGQAAQELGGEAFKQCGQQIMERFKCSEEEAANRLQTAWNNALHAPLQQPDLPSLATPRSAQGIDIPPPPKMEVAFPDFDLDSTISEHILHAPSEFAIGKMEAMEYIELWYFTTEGYKEARNNIVLAPQLPTEASKPSKYAIIDENLTWDQIMTARHNLASAANQAGWPHKHTHAVVELYTNLERLKFEGYNTRALILYQAVARRAWYAALKGRRERFNISRINERLLTKLEGEIQYRDQLELQRQASIFSVPYTSNRILTITPIVFLRIPLPLSATLQPSHLSKNLHETHKHRSPCYGNVLQFEAAKAWDELVRGRRRATQREGGTGRRRSSRSTST